MACFVCLHCLFFITFFLSHHTFYILQGESVKVTASLYFWTIILYMYIQPFMKIEQYKAFVTNFTICKRKRNSVDALKKTDEMSLCSHA